MNSGIEGNSYGAVISPSRITYKVGQGIGQSVRDAILIGTNDDEVNYGNTQNATDLILQMPMMYNNGAYIGSGTLSLQVPDGTAKCGNARGNGSIDLQTVRNSAGQVASNVYSVVMGNSNTASGNTSIAIGYANTSSGNNSTAMGSVNTASGNNSTAIGYANTASGSNSVAMIYKSSTNNISSKIAIGTLFSGIVGAYQMGQLGLGAITTDATTTVLKSDTNAVSASNIYTLQNNNAVSFTIEVVAQNVATGMTGRWEAKGLIKRGANASATALVGTSTITLTNGDAEGWIATGSVAVSADTTNGALTVTVTGAASTTIHWMCRINAVEIV
jgi:hypothetical protein